MSTYNEQLQKVWHEYEKAHGYLPSRPRDAVKWGVEQRMIEAPDFDPYERLAEDMSRALREEYATDRLGRRYRLNHAVRVSKGGVQYTIWAILGEAPAGHMQKAFIQRREQIVGDCVQLATDVEVYNDMNSGQPSIQMLLDFRDDVAERRFWDRDDAA
ncbi:MAG: hypothetical protein JWM33_1787 [Caulobacteraceae bacterium]|nr:hypothetical protein [Caulobacteraceae bacterium]